MSANPTHTIPSFSGTFGIPAKLALNPKMPKEPSSPSRTDTQIERECIYNEINRQRNNNGQRTTSAIKNWGKCRYYWGFTRFGSFNWIVN